MVPELGFEAGALPSIVPARAGCKGLFILPCGYGDIHGPKPCEFIGFGAMDV